MKFSIVVNMDRTDPNQDMRDVVRECLELVQIADEGGFEIAFTAEHHTIEVTVAPNPFTLLTYWGQHTKNIRLGTAVVSAPYWHPIRLAGEAALTDIILEGRLELGLGRGSYQYEFDRMAGGMPQGDGGKYLREIVPLLNKLWAGDVEHKGELFQFPAATSVPKPLQNPGPRMWVAARDPNTFDFAVKNGCHIMSTPLQRPHEEVIDLCKKFEMVVAANPQVPRPEHMMLRRACVYENPDEWRKPVDATIDFGRHFENLFRNLGTVRNGFPEPVDVNVIANKTDYSPEALHENMLFGTADEVIAKLEKYEEAGVDHFLYAGRFGLPHPESKKSLELFCRDVIPHFQSNESVKRERAV
ncbi:LLM class flavin-dependent oxidoreductase [Limibacillus halophilus]|uniref:Alkanesulfonate monooxygenase SsuD/methylene tetrahydromethanopterin reductase-like flavin-dependent oxidoreductase (Luciferase family) n=1 Tax=Limibacillus halophilus TaxID=1579333 RepID=A0A839SNN8_9PROT|nr:LLM class flavin-dependent oxidoreductase [Limibacillus halophilus]MBB3064517.1 alkanesulfonate monooxygenase SsuD/methylene tetrahydromethanopterin reductase-like flavin-dependent oxidoreductase (luciferase family) [Limibacillus halophilus]